VIDDDYDHVERSYGPYKNRQEAKNALLENGWKPGGCWKNGFVAGRKLGFGSLEMRARIEGQPYTFFKIQLPKDVSLKS